MRHLLLQLETEQRASDKNRLNEYFLQQTSARTLAHGHGQWFELIDTKEEQYTVLIAVALCLAEGDRIGVCEISHVELPQEGGDTTAWIRARTPLDNMVTIPTIEVLRRW